MSNDDVMVYLVDRAGKAANAFGAKLEGREGVELVGGADNLDEALEEIGATALDVILVGTDVGGPGLVHTVEQVLTVGRDAAVVVLSSAGDKALVTQGVRAGAMGSLDRAASPGETITALHVYKRRQHGEAVDMSLAEPPPQTQGLRVSGALPRFPSASEQGDRGIMVGAEEIAAEAGTTEEPTLTTAEPRPGVEAQDKYQEQYDRVDEPASDLKPRRAIRRLLLGRRKEDDLGWAADGGGGQGEHADE